MRVYAGEFESVEKRDRERDLIEGMYAVTGAVNGERESAPDGAVPAEPIALAQA
jgi:hypothetical protein